MKLVIVESPSKAKTIEKYLGKEYKVLASYGHVRQIPSKNGSIDTDKNFSIIWEETDQAKKHLRAIENEAKKASSIYLATDPDREGEAISWHIYNYLNEKNIINSKHIVKRVVFNAITKKNINDAFNNPRTIDNKLVSAYLARTSLDYLVGFNISPILWHKLPGSRSAGRVQSVALKLICEREEQREDFTVEEYWQIQALLKEQNKDKETKNFKAKLVTFNSKKLEKLSIKTKEQADQIIREVKNAKGYYIKEIVKKKIVKNPQAPFTTSSLQQDAFNKLGFGAKKTMSIAQKLYEGIKIDKNAIGLITYMRTDATDITPEFISNIRNYIKENIGKDYLPQTTRTYKTKTKNAQEAHEAIRPTDINLPPEKIKKFVTEEVFKLYNLIWKRTIASQMSSAEYSNTSIIIPNNDSSIVLKANGSILNFEGFYKIYGNIQENEENILPILEEGNKIKCEKVLPSQHFTEPPPRYTEASLVKTLEELGIGRPSTYASIISVLLNRKYAYIEGKRFYPEQRGRILNSFLNKFFTRYVDYKFTANMEEDLDKISRGDSNFFNVLNNFWQTFFIKTKEAKSISPNEILETLNEDLGDRFIGKQKTCPTCNKGNLLIKYSKFGAFIACSLYPDCKHIEQLITQGEEESSKQLNATKNNTEITFKNDTTTSEKLTLKHGPYGPYIEYITKDSKTKRIPVPKALKPENITEEQAYFLASLPKKFDDISLSIGRFGPYLKQNNLFFSLKNINIFNLTEKEVKNIINEQMAKKLGTNLGVHPKTKKTITLHKNHFGSYLMYNNQKIKLSKEYKNKDISLKEATTILDSSQND